MHPIEQLRFVARATGADAGLLVQEAASALTVFRSDPAALVVACKRLLARQPAVGPLWWLTTRLVLASDVSQSAREAIAELDSDPTSRELAHLIPDGASVAIAGWPSQTVEALVRRGDVSVLVLDVEGQGSAVARRLERSGVEAEAVEGGRIAGVVAESSLVIVEAAAAGEAACLVDPGAAGLAATARSLSTPVWLVAGVGRRIAEPYWHALVEQVVDLELPSWLQNQEVLSYGLVDRVLTPSGPTSTEAWTPTDLACASELLGRPV